MLLQKQFHPPALWNNSTYKGDGFQIKYILKHFNRHQPYNKEGDLDTMVKQMVKRDANSQLAFLSFVMAMLNAVVNIISAVNSNNNNNNNDNNNNDNNNNNENVNENEVMSMNSKRSFW